jgi:hypothetical protein
MRRFLSLVLLLMSLNAFAQKEKIETVRSVRGEFSVVLELSDVTGREAMQMARDDAKRQALEKVCGSRVNIWNQMEMSAAGDVFNSLSINQTEGEIVEFEIKEEGASPSEARPSETVFYCIADVKVKKGHDPDPDFYAAVNGLKSVYFSGDILNFNIIPYKDCFMKIFLLEDDKNGYLLYPNTYDKAKQLKAHEVFDIAAAPYYQFEMFKGTDAPKEINRLVFVFTKTERPFNELETSRPEIERWMAVIPNDQKYLHFAVIEIRDK